MEHKAVKEEPEEGQNSSPSAKQLQRILRLQEREERARSHKEQEEQRLTEFYATYPHLFGVAPLVEKKPQNESEEKIYTNIKDLTEENIGQTILIRARFQSVQLRSNKLCFVVLRQNMHSIQAIVEATDSEEPIKIPREMVKLVAKIPPESIVEVTGVIRSATVRGTTQHSIELVVQKVFIVSKSEQLPILYEDLARPFSIMEKQRNEVEEIEKRIHMISETMQGAADEATRAQITSEIVKLQEQRAVANKYPEVGLNLRLNHRVIDLRTAANHAIFKIQSGVGMLFRQALYERGFIEIHTPKLVGAETEGGASVFKVKYFERNAYLAQSPQFSKQMAVIGDMERVFEIGPVFRAENAMTARHLTEFTGLDLEMQIYQHYHEILEILEHVFATIFNGINTQYHHELTIISQQHPFEPFQYNPIRITHAEAVQMLNASPWNEYPAGELDDFMTVQERLLGALVKEKYGTDFFIVDQFPLAVRPFYTMPNPEDARYANAFDVFMRGQEIISGSQRVHSYELLLERALQLGTEPESIAPYLEGFKFGAPPHGGFGVGLERVVLFFLNLGNIRRTSMFPRDPHRLIP